LLSPKIDTDPIETEDFDHIKTGRSAAAVRGAFWSAVNVIIPTALNSAVFIVSSRFLTPNDFGIVALAMSFVMFASAIAPAAYGEAIIQLAKVSRAHLDSVFWMCSLSGVAIYILLVAFARTIASVSGHITILEFLPVLGLRLFFDLGAVVPNALIARSMSFHIIALRTTIATLVSSAVCIALLTMGYGIWALAISQISVSATSGVAAFIGAKWKPGLQFKFEAIKELSRYGIFASGNRFLQFMNLDQIIIGSFIGTAPLGIFNFARRLFQILNDVIAGALTSVSHTLFSSLQDEQAKMREAFLMATFGSSILCFPAFMGLGAVAATAIPFIFGPQWMGAITPTRWFCVIGLMSCIGVIQSSLINSQGKTNWWFYYQLFRQALTLVTIVLLRNSSVNVIVMNIAIQVIIFWPVTLFMVSKLIDLNVVYYFKQFFEPFLASLMMLVAVLFIGKLLQTAPPSVQVTTQVIFGTVAYGMSIFALSKNRVILIAQTFLKRRKA
jgi:teichuronic acid exporter